jgi:hypothetical protein
MTPVLIDDSEFLRLKKKFAYLSTPTPTQKYDPSQPRDEQGQWSKTTGRTFTSDEGYEWHEKGPVAEWAKQLPYKDAQAINNYAGFGYHDINDIRRGTYKPPTIAHFVRAATEEEYEASRFQITEEYIKQHGHPFGNRPESRKPEDPFERVLDAEGNYVGHLSKNQFFKHPVTGEKVFISVQRAGPDLETQKKTEVQADALDDLIKNRGYVLPEAIVVERGAYLPGVTFEQLQGMQYEGPNGEPPAVWEEKGFTSTMVGEAGGRAKSYPALGKWESISHRHGSASGVLVKYQDEVGSAVRFHITLPKGTKVAAVEPVRRLSHKFPRIPDPSPRPEDIEAKYWTTPDYTATPTVDDEDLKDKHRRTESELLLGSGARFRVTKAHHGTTYETGDPTLKPVKIVEVYLEYIGGGSSQGD